MFINYKCLNKIAMKKNVPLFWIDDLFNYSCGAQIFSKIDMKNMYHQI